jgi:hypothetical protein
MGEEALTASAASLALFLGSSVAFTILTKTEVDHRAMLSSKEVVLALRKRLFSKSLSLSYENSDPLLIVEVDIRQLQVSASSMRLHLTCRRSISRRVADVI